MAFSRLKWKGNAVPPRSPTIRLQTLRDCPPLSAAQGSAVYLADLCTPVSDIASKQHLRSARSNQLDVPRHRRTQFGRRAFSVAVPMAWNALPDSIRDTALSTCSFRRHLETSFLPLLAHQRIRGFAFMSYINPRLILISLLVI